MGLKEVLHPDDAGMIETRERPGLAEKTIQPPQIILLVLFRSGQDGPVRFPCRRTRRHVFLDGDHLLEQGVPAAIGDAEPP